MLDEPLSALDAHLQNKVLVEIRDVLRTFSNDSLIVTHNTNEAYTLCKRIVVIDKGSVIDRGETKEVFSTPKTKASAILTGCKNIINAKKIDNYTVNVPSWGVTFKTKNRVLHNLSAIGVRAHSFQSNLKKNNYQIEIIETIEEPFELTVKFRYYQQDKKSELLWHSCPKKAYSSKLPESLGILPEDILLLYD